MKVSITSIELKSPLSFFKLSFLALHIANQLKISPYIEFKKKGFWTKHYAMTLWRNEGDMRRFFHSEAHLEVIKKSESIAKEIKIITIEVDRLPHWKEACILLKNKGEVYRSNPFQKKFISSSIYKSDHVKTELLKLYNKKQKSLKIPTEDIYVDTFAGRTHILASGDVHNPPVVILHGINAGAPISLEAIQGISKNFRIYALDTIGQTTKSAETRLSAKNDDYGKWLEEVLICLKIENACFVGISYGAFLLQKLIQFAPERINKVILVVPAGIVNGDFLNSMSKLTFPLLKFLVTKTEKSLVQFMDAFYMTKKEDDILFQKNILLGTKMDYRRPPLLKKENLIHFNSPTFIMAADMDVFFPGHKVLGRSIELFNNLKDYHVLKKTKHIPDESIYSEIENKIIDWLNY
ncbi:alpha/beta fold hydrolase [Flagellimonas sp. S3867]|uniref:alpha/beta fold hydrolase n=1 Tax=Flagellimonas sp. S3867 TaxID=2768063 RepID=UPI001688C1BE|nr:alpha/beta hydrolase [Flagellimonas sp. S3867]